MIETFLFGIVLYAKNEHCIETIHSIIENKDFFLKNIKIVVVDTQEDNLISDSLQSLESVYSGNIVYIKSFAKNSAAAYNEGLPHAKAKYVHFTSSETLYSTETFNRVKEHSEKDSSDLFAIHTKFLGDKREINDTQLYSENQWDFTKELSYLPLYLNRYFIKYTCIKESVFHEEYHEDALKFFLINCFKNQSQLTIVGGTLLGYWESQERNQTTYQVKKEKWWYIPQVTEAIIPMLKKYSEDGEIPIQIQQLLYYMIRIKFYHNMNSRYEYALNYDEVNIFLASVKEALQYIDDKVIRDVNNMVVTPKYMIYYFLKLKHGSLDYCAEIKQNKNGELAFYVEEDEFIKLDDMLVSLQGFTTDSETKERIIEAEWFYCYIIQNSKSRLQIKVNGKPAIIEIDEKNALDTCFGKMARKKFRFKIRIPKEERKLMNHLEFSVTIRGEKHMIKAKYARRKLIGRIKTKIKQGKLSKVFQRFAKSRYIVFYNIGKLFLKQKPSQVVMLSDSRASLSGNLEFIDKELKKQDYQVEYFFKRSLTEPKTLKEQIHLCKLMAQSKYILVDDFYPIVYPLKIRKNAKLIQVWHAMGAFKTVGFSRVGKPGGPNPNSLTHRNYTAAITSAEGIRENYAEAFGIDLDKVYATGVPRTDIFFDQAYIAETKERIYKNYPSLKEKKVVLFAPTFRGAGQKSAHYNFNWIDFQQLEAELGDEYVFVVKLHPFIKNIENVPMDSEFIIDMSNEREINDLLFVTDVLITDYSSVIFEASLLNISTVFYVPDLEEYTASRDFYYPFERYTYGEIAEDMDSLIQGIVQPKNDVQKLQGFKEHFCGACDGHATERFVEMLFD